MTTTAPGELERLRVSLGAPSEALSERPEAASGFGALAPDRAPAPELAGASMAMGILLASAPVAVVLSVAVGLGMLLLIGGPLYLHEIIAATVVTLAAGMAATVPVIVALQRRRGLVQASLATIGIRMVVILGGLLLAMGPSWGLAREPLVFWVLGQYFPLLVAETAALVWLFNQED